MNDTLICFLKYPQSGQVKTRLAVDLGAENACVLYRDLAERVITEVFPLMRSYELNLFVDPLYAIDRYKAWLGDQFRYELQLGDTLGDRLAHAGRWAFDRGYDKLIIVGSDCIGMDEDFIVDAFRGLDRSDFVIGPSSDGGYYLLGMRQLHAFVFDDIPWSGPDVAEITLDRIESRGLKASLLTEKQDVDNLDDLTQLRRQLPQEHFLAKKIDRMVLERLTHQSDSMDEK